MECGTSVGGGGGGGQCLGLEKGRPASKLILSVGHGVTTRLWPQ